MLELDTTIITPAPVFETSGHVARFADWMVKDTKTGDVLRADHLVKGVLEARLVGDREARGVAALEVKEDEKDKKRKKKIKSAVVKLADDVAQEYESVLAQVSKEMHSFVRSTLMMKSSWITTLVRSWVNCVENIRS